MKTTYLTDEKQLAIARSIKPISKETVLEEYIKLSTLYSSENIRMREIGEQPPISYANRTGNNIVDYFTFCERLKTRGKYNANYFDFIENIEWFKTKKFIRNMITYYATIKNKTNKKNDHVVYKEIYNICISSINIFRPIVAAEIYCLYKPTTVLDFTCGWGGRLVGACVTNVPKYIGIDINHNLNIPYQNLVQTLLNTVRPAPITDICIMFKDALTVDYSNLDYDFVLTSPPYYSLEKYPNNIAYNSKTDMNQLFYKPIFEMTFMHLNSGGHYCLNVNNEIYQQCCIPTLGEAHDKIPLKKNSRQNGYHEYIYVWHK
jgi:hypothetical protein